MYKNAACSMIGLKHVLFCFVFFLITPFKLLNLGMKAKLREIHLLEGYVGSMDWFKIAFHCSAIKGKM